MSALVDRTEPAVLRQDADRALNIAVIRQRYTPFGGAERFLSRAMNALERRGARLTIVTRRWNESEQSSIVCNPFYVGSLWRDWGFARCVCRTLVHHHFDLVQSHERLPCCDVYRAGDGVHHEWLAQRRRKQGWRGRLSVALNPYHHYALAMERRTFASERLRAVICISQMVRDEIRKYFGLPEEMLHVIYPGIDVDAFHPRLRTEYRGRLRQELGIAETDLTLVFVGSGFERKGVEVLLRAVRQARTFTHVLIVGRDKRLERYRRLAHELGIAERVRFLGGQQDVRPYYAAADAFVMPTLYEPFGNVNIEAMAMGLPIVTSTKAGAGELIEPGHQGYVCDALDVAGFAAAIDALRDPVRCEAMGQAARRRAEFYGIDVMGEQLLQLYEKLLRESGRA